MGPVMVPFDVSDTAPLPNARPSTVPIETPFRVRSGNQLALTIENCKARRRTSFRECRRFVAGRIHPVDHGRAPSGIFNRKEAGAGIDANSFVVRAECQSSAESRYATLVHKLAYLDCGHLGTPNGQWWPDRQNLFTGCSRV
jgi:hypothetical protein